METKMKRMMLVLVACVFGIAVWAQGTVSVTARNKSIIQVIKQVEQKSNYAFLFDETLTKQLQRKVSIDAKNRSVESVVTELLQGTGLQCKVSQRQVLIYKAEAQQDKSQQYQVHAIVYDEEGQPLYGANVYVPDTEMGTVTDGKGEFSFRVPTRNTLLRITFVGYNPVVVSAYEAMKGIHMSQAANSLGEVKVVADGYNVIDKRLSASATTTLKQEDFMMQNVPNLSNMLQGKVAGLSVVAPSGSPNAAPRMRIRGSSTIHGDAAPVWVIDGVIWEETVNVTNDEVNAVLRGASSLDQVNDNASLSLLGNAITGLNPHDIESITFLKDASATAIYGTRAANGVIVVKTKKGSKGKTSVNFSSSIGITSRPTYEQYNMMNSKERIQLSKDMVANGYVFDIKPYSTGFEGALYDLYDKKITDAQFADRVSTLETRNTDWFDLLFQNAVNQDYNVAVSGGAGSMRYYTSLGYNDARGSTKGDEMRRFNMNMNMDFKVSKWLTANAKMLLSDRTSDGYYMVNPFDYAIYATRTLTPEEYYTQTQTRIEGSNNNYMLRYNIFNELDHTSNTTKVQQITAQTSLHANFGHGFQADALFSYGLSDTRQTQWADEQSYYIAGIRGYEVGAVLPGSADELASRLAKGGILIDSDQKQKTWTARMQLNYNKTFGSNFYHTIQAMAGFEARSLTYNGLKEQEYGYFPDRGNKVSYEYNNDYSGSTDWHSSLDKHTASIVSQLNNTISEFATFVYSYRNRYILNANLRMDASNRFGQYTNHKFLPVWSLAGRWNVAEEGFLPKWMNDLSVRASYGMQGNIPTTVGPNLVVRYPAAVVNRWSGEYQLQISRLPCPNLRWEKTRTINLGLEWSLLNGRITGTFNYYNKKGMDILFQLPVGLEYGQEKVFRNGADLNNYGLELSMTFSPVRTRDWDVSITPIWSKNTNRVANVLKQEYTVEDYLSGNAYEDGKPVNAIYSWKFTGLDPKTGYATFANTASREGDLKGPMEVRDLLEYSGSKDPKFSGGFSTMVRWKSFSMSMMWSYQWGNVVRLNYLFEGSNLMPQPYANVSRNLMKAWKKPGDELTTTVPGFNRSGEFDYSLYYNTTTNGIRSSSSYQMYNFSDIRIAKGDFLRCRNLSLSYSFPSKAIQCLGINNLSLSANVTNPFIFCSSKFDGQDPEIQGTGTTAQPITRCYTFSVSVGL